VGCLASVKGSEIGGRDEDGWLVVGGGMVGRRLAVGRWSRWLRSN
jgi:hypothetical protein